MAIKILSVDDELDLEILLTQYFRRKIKKGEYEFYFAHNGLEALQMMLAMPDFDVILSDINMPEMDGLTLLTKINEMRNPALKCIMVSAYGDMENIRSAMNQGAFDFTTKPINLEDLERTIEKAAEQIAFIKQAQKEHTQLESIQNDLHVAQEIQQTILPKTFPPFPELKSFDLYAYMSAAKYVGGDFYDFFLIDDNKLCFVVADVSGKGIPAALFMMSARAIIKNLVLITSDVLEIVKELNTQLNQGNETYMFVSAFISIIDLQTGIMTFVSAGHNPPLIKKRGNEKFEYMKVKNNCILGIEENVNFEKQEIKLEKEDVIFVYTDGVTEARNEEKLYGTSKLEETLNKEYDGDIYNIVPKIRKSIDEFSEGKSQYDDITMLVFKYNK
ncbi:SpoIIE family protein phosphatase [uncultured Parabacteroides sp.]|mgnify:CR=1 FL=1|uniref:PP2C family protein-serine/threonine phosphatase n=1 Tax=uncultured Parabacteroides sp. TaxID=512312 RepID=UPI00262B648A|nr:SpoIIE family protein phosphatase [uncultured Parabacteroides sp.]